MCEIVGRYIHRNNFFKEFPMFSTNQIVKGKVAGTFVVLALRNVGGVSYAQLKEICPVTGKTRRGEICLPVDALKLAA